MQEKTGIDGKRLGAQNKKEQFHGIAVDNFNASRVTLWRALRVASPVERGMLWPAGLLREHLLLEGSMGDWYYVVRRSPSMVSLWQLCPTED